VLRKRLPFGALSQGGRAHFFSWFVVGILAWLLSHSTALEMPLHPSTAGWDFQDSFYKFGKTPRDLAQAIICQLRK
jgi:hypothetical protein